MKVLWHSNAPWTPTGYGAQVRLFAPRLGQVHDLAVSAYYGLEGSRLRWDGIDVFPGLGGEFGNTSLPEHAVRWFRGGPRDGLVLTLMDVWVLDAAMCSQLNMASWVPVDHDPVSPGILRFFEQSSAVPLAMSRFGQEQLENYDPIYVPHGVDMEEFKPHPRASVREAVGMDEDAFLVGMVAANKGRPSRKGFQQAFEAFRYFHEKHENARLYLHTQIDPDYSQGEDILTLIASLGIPEGVVTVADQYRQKFDPLAPAAMAQVYSAFDVLLNPSMGEGFGIPVLEAQACGVPAIVTDFSAMKEVCGQGWKVGCRPYWTGQKSWQGIADVPDIVGALEECHGRTDAEVATQATEARRHAGKYEVGRVTEKYFLPALEECRERFGLEVQEEVPA